MSSNSVLDVAIVGSGPTGLAAAMRLRRAGVGRVVVLEREAEPGGAPRHCGNPPFGLLEHKRVETGQVYAGRLVERALSSGVEIRPCTSVVRIDPGCRLTVAHSTGPYEIHAKKVLVATGTRETPRSARLVSGGRPAGICTTGALQAMVYFQGMVPFRRPLVVGSEPVSFSALVTCRKAGVRPVGMVEEMKRPALAWPFYYLSSFFGVKLMTGARSMRILGDDRVASVEVELDGGRVETFECDGVLFTGKFTPESALVRMSHLAVDPLTGSPVVDAWGRCSDLDYYAAGNLLAPAKMAVNCWRGGRKVADAIIRDLAGKLSVSSREEGVAER